MNFPKTLVFLTVLNLTVATELACAAELDPTPVLTQTVIATPAAPVAAVPKSVAATTAARQTASASEDIRDIHGPISIPYSWLWAAYITGGIALAAAAFAGWRWYGRYRKERAKLPYEIALEHLEKARALMTPEQTREYSFAVSEITRRYIESRFQERAARRTTEEFLYDLLAQTDTPLAAHRERLEDFLRHCDLAKFARWQLSLPDMESMHESARAFILETRPQPTGKIPAVAARNGQTPPAAEPQLTHF